MIRPIFLTLFFRAGDICAALFSELNGLNYGKF